ncbi:uncharacterized protein RAG0_06858 [Rhynchosporium agropyri]|uniref:HpcH/HpaI aldolase/citrate lyase domain-containing protein n=1 Tax=Rhynchosporium agropyri TaxID=914238 RepID=A0A1E1KIV7_9HELO|nr:uncharacterized protein RAG0_06858 [Rhynchosporium agropyri]
MQPVPTEETVRMVNACDSTVFIMVETADALACVDELAAVHCCDVLLVGANDLASEIGTLGNCDHQDSIEALRKVGEAAKKHGKIFGIAGLYTRTDILDKVVNEFGARWTIGANYTGLLCGAAKANNALIRSI